MGECNQYSTGIREGWSRYYMLAFSTSTQQESHDEIATPRFFFSNEQLTFLGFPMGAGSMSRPTN